MSLFRNRTVLGIVCIATALLVCFGITPMVNKGLSSKTMVVRMKVSAKTGSQVTDKMLETVEVGNYNLPAGVIKDPKEIVGKYLLADVFADDYLTAAKLSDTPAKENEYLYNLDGKKQAMSITLSSFAEGVSGKLMSGDIVSIIVPDYRKTGETVIPSELKYVEVIAVTAKSGNDANTDSQANSANQDEEKERELPSTVTVLVTPEQSKILAMFEDDGEMHLSLVYRGDEATCKKFIKAQDDVLEEIKLMMEEAEAAAREQSLAEGETAPEMKTIGEEGTTIVTGNKKNNNSLIIQGNKIATSPLPATAATGAVDIQSAANILAQ